jgi:hypothetical protein
VLLKRRRKKRKREKKRREVREDPNSVALERFQT